MLKTVHCFYYCTLRSVLLITHIAVCPYCWCSLRSIPSIAAHCGLSPLLLLITFHTVCCCTLRSVASAVAHYGQPCLWLDNAVRIVCCESIGPPRLLLLAVRFVRDCTFADGGSPVWPSLVSLSLRSHCQNYTRSAVGTKFRVSQTLPIPVSLTSTERGRHRQADRQTDRQTQTDSDIQTDAR